MRTSRVTNQPEGLAKVDSNAVISRENEMKANTVEPVLLMEFVGAGKVICTRTASEANRSKDPYPELQGA